MQIQVVRVQIDSVSSNAVIPVCFHLRGLRGEQSGREAWAANANRQPAIGCGNMSSEQNAPEVQMHQGPPTPPAQMDTQMDGQMDQNRPSQMDQDGSAQADAHSPQHGMGQSK